MHILFLTDNFPPEVNASSTRVYERALYWVKWGHQVTIITCAPNFPEGKVYDGYKNRWYQTEIIDGIRVVRVKTYIAQNAGFIKRIIDFVSYMFMAIIAGIFQKKPDKIIATSPQFFAAVGGWILSIIKRKPFIFELSDIWPASITAVGAMKQSKIIKLLEKFELFLYRRASKIIALTNSFKKNLIGRGIDENKISVVRNGVELTKYSHQEKEASLLKSLNLENKLIIGYIGTHGMAHNLSNVLAAANLLKSNPNIHFLFVGAGAEKEILVKTASQLELNNVTFIPKQPKDKIKAYWSICDIALVHLKNDPVFSEVVPSKIFEAMAMGLPILICSPEGEASELVQNANAGWWVQAGDPNLLSSKINKLLEDPKQIKQYASSSLEASTRFSREAQAENFLDSLQDCIEKEGVILKS